MTKTKKNKKEVRRVKKIESKAVFGEWGFTLATSNNDILLAEIKRLTRLGFNPYTQDCTITFTSKNVKR